MTALTAAENAAQAAGDGGPGGDPVAALLAPVDQAREGAKGPRRTAR